MTTKELDNLTNIAFINFFTLGKETKKICLCNVNVKDSRHLACLHISKIVKDIYGYEVYLSGDLFNYLDISWRCKSKKWLKRARRNIDAKMIDMEDFVSHIEKANKQIGGFSQVYHEYFKGFDR